MNPFSKTLTQWYDKHQRNLPWRASRDPYHIWMSEIMLQQTRVDQVIPYYQNFLKLFPTIVDMARADEDEILSAWQGLGYYSRARNLHATSKIVAYELGGQFPKTSDELIKLPGIGKYTSAAIASICFGEPTPVLDGNVFRFIARYKGLESEPSDTMAQREIMKFLHASIPTDDAGTFNQALMEFGSQQCIISNPDCELCPFKDTCKAYELNKVSVIPRPKKKATKRDRYFTIFMPIENGKTIVQRREQKDIWQGLYSFPLQESKKLLDWEETTFFRQTHEVSGMMTYDLPKHLLTHQNIYCRVYVGRTSLNSMSGKTLDLDHLSEVGFPRLITKFLERHHEVISQMS